MERLVASLRGLFEKRYRAAENTGRCAEHIFENIWILYTYLKIKKMTQVASLRGLLEKRYRAAENTKTIRTEYIFEILILTQIVWNCAAANTGIYKDY